MNRERELALLDGLRERAELSPGALVAVVSGMHGVGKSAVGSLWAHRNRAWFGGGTLCADFSRRRNPHVGVSDVLAAFLRELGTSDVAMPVTLRERQRLFEHLTADRKLLVLLDDVDQPAQALAVIPSGAGSVVVVTSAFRLEELVREGAQPVFLDPLDDPAARDLLAELAGAGRVDREPGPTRAVLAACGGLPIALCVCGARLATHPDRRVSWLAAQLEAGPRRLAVLSPPGAFDVSRVFGIAYEDLGPSAARLYRRLGLHPGPDFAVAAAAAVGGVSSAEASVTLEQLEDAYLLQGEGQGRFRVHQLVREHMRACAAVDEHDESREEAVRRAVDWYTAAVAAADHAVVDDRLRLDTGGDLTALDLPVLRQPREAFAWFASESWNVLAAQRAALEHEWYERVWQIAEALWPLCASHKRFSDWISSHENAIAAAEKLNDQAVMARMRSQLARAYAELGEAARAEAEMSLALAAAGAAADPRLLASVIEFGGVCELRAGELGSALESFRQARAGFEACGMERGVALQDYHLGWCLVEAGDDLLALAPLARAEARLRSLNDPISVGRSRVRRGEALWHLGRASEAREALSGAIVILDGAGVEFEQAEAHEVLAEIADADEDPGEARTHRQRAYRLYRGLGHPRADALLVALSGEGPA